MILVRKPLIKPVHSTISSTIRHWKGSRTMREPETDGLPLLVSPRNTPNLQSTPEIEKKHVHNVYDAIAPHFSSTRYSKWPKVRTFLNSLAPGSLVLDTGCGNGKYLGLNPNCYFVGCDISAPLINICLDKGHEVLVADAVNLPYRTGYGDAAISIAVLHHLSTESRRRKAVEELVRAVKVGGLVLITVWAREQEDKTLVNKWNPLSQKYLEEWIGPRAQSPAAFCQQEYFVPWHLPYHRAEMGGASANDLGRKDDSKGSIVYDRYYHVFGQGELERLACDVDGALIIDRFYDKSNWCIILQKTSSS